jgi:hypothetical protein
MKRESKEWYQRNKKWNKYPILGISTLKNGLMKINQY